MLNDSFDLNFSDSGSTKKLFNTSNESSKIKNKGKSKSSDNSYSQNSNYSQTSQNSNSQNQKKPKFSHVFITIYKYERLFKCQMQTLFSRIRFHPKISIIQTNNSICISNQVDFNCSYALDFSSIPPFSYQDFTPVIELYRRISNRSELVGISLLPLKEIERVSIQKKILTYFYHNSRVPVKDIMTGSIVGTLVVSIGFGFPDHQTLFDPNFYSSFQNQPSVKINPTTNQIESENDENENEECIQSETIPKKNRHKHHHHRHQKKKSNQWQKLATAAGWKPPEFVGSEWKTKAIKRGWIPPEKQVKSSIAINCKKEDIVTKESVSTQYDPIILAEIENEKNFTFSSTFSDENQNNSDDELKDIIDFLNPKKKKKNSDSDSSQLILTSPSTIFQKELPKLGLTPVMLLLDVEAESDNLSTDSTDDSDTALHKNVNELIDNVLNCSKTCPINQKVMKNDDSLLKKNKNDLNDDSDVYDVSSDVSNIKHANATDSSSGSSSASNVKKCLCKMDDSIKKILDIYGIEDDFF